MKNIRTTIAAAATLLAAIATTAPADARNINVHGTVVRNGSREPIEGVSIRNAATGRLIGSTNMDGQFTVTVDDSASLLFSVMGSEETTVAVNGKLTMEVTMSTKTYELNEVQVIAKNVSKALVIEPTELDLKGNYIYLKKRVNVPDGLMSSSMRMIIQPSIYNVSRRTLTYLKPTVLDGRRYAITQERMYDWKPNLDPLTPYRTVRENKSDNVMLIADSLYVQNTKDDYMCVVMTSLENYNHVIYADTFMIARGTVNPLRFLRYNLRGYEMTNENYLPQPEISLRDSRGDMNLAFAMGDSKLDLKMGNNSAEINKLLQEFRSIESDPDMTLKTFTISGVASPEGRYENNREIAASRMESAMQAILQSVPESLVRNAKVSSTSRVADWSEVVALLRADGYNTEANEMEKVISTYSDPDARTYRMRKLSFYKTLLAAQYLPRLRKVTYELVSSKYRPLTDEEIAELYKRDNTNLTAYQFWRRYKIADSEAEQELIMRRALQIHPDFLAAATDLSALLINREEADETVLQPFFTNPKQWTKLPEESRYDYAVSAMAAGHFTLADSLMVDLPNNDKFHKGKAYCSAINGRYADVISEISEDSQFNEVLLLLALKDNEAAWENAQKLGDSAEEEYVKAIAANRVDNYIEAITHLENALRLDPSLRDVARIDGDVVDLLKDEEDE